MSITHRLQLHETESKKMLCVGLQSRNLCTSLMSKPCTSERDLMVELRDFIQVEEERKERFGAMPTKSKMNHRNTDKKGNYNVKLTTEPVTDTGQTRLKTTGLRCYNCQVYGHMSRDCPQPKKTYQCTKCRVEGHTAKYCTLKTPEVSLIEKNIPSKFVYLKSVYINSNMIPVAGLVDTGSAYCIIKQSIACEYNLLIKPKTVNMHVYGNAQCVTSYGETEAIIRIDDVAEKVTLLVVNDHVQSHDIIVGRTFIDCDDVSFVKTQGELKFKYGMIFPYHGCEVPKEPGMNSEHRVIIKNSNEMIPASSTKIVEVQINNEDLNILMINDNQKEDIC